MQTNKNVNLIFSNFSSNLVIFNLGRSLLRSAQKTRFYKDILSEIAGVRYSRIYRINKSTELVLYN